MIEQVTLGDLERLGSLVPDGPSPKPKQRAMGILLEIVGRLPHPRAYISEPTHMPEEDRRQLWLMAYDMLSAELDAQGKGVIEGDTLRLLALFCPVMPKLSDTLDPLWQMLLSCRYVDEVYIPRDGERSKRHATLEQRASSLGIPVFFYRPQHVRGIRMRPVP